MNGNRPRGEEEAPPYEPGWTANENVNQEKPRYLGSGFMYDGARPAGRPKNAILFGETGVGKSSVINLLADAEVADTSSGLEGCTLHATEYSFTFPGQLPLRIFDTVGLEEPEMGVNTFLGAIGKAHELIKSLHSTGGIDLLILCIRGGRITASVQRNYRLFYDILCEGKVPLAIVVTNLEQEDVMEAWWGKNEAMFANYSIHSIDHACVTALPARIQAYAQKRAESQEALRNMLPRALRNTNTPHVRDTQSWLATIVNQLWSWLTKNIKFLKKKDLLWRLESECHLPRSEAETLTQMLIT
ncbi:hypothetical protein V8E55_007297 [Tylopilus felleus]